MGKRSVEVDRRKRNASTNITPAQRRIFEAVRRLTAQGGQPPILEEIASRVGLQKSTVHSHLTRLKNARLVTWEAHTPRSLKTTTDPDLLAAYNLDLSTSPSQDGRGVGERGAVVWELPEQPARRLPMLGRAAAGPFVAAGGDRQGGDQDFLELPPELSGSAQYAVRLEGSSMEGRRLFDGDFALVDQRQPVREDDIVAVVVEDRQTDELKANVKIFARRDGAAWLLSANPAYPPIPAVGVRVLGRVIAVVRRL
jgi:repressor LexA